MLHAAFALLISLGAPPSDATPTDADAAPTDVRRLRVLARLDLRLAPDRFKATDVIGEVRDIWTPYVDIDFADSGTPNGTLYDDEVWVVVVDHPRALTPPGSGALGWIDFYSPGQPSDTVTVSTAVVAGLIKDGRWGGRPVRDLPRGVRERLAHQALSRGMAHEIGHNLLRSSAHAPSGLMRSRLSVADIMAPGHSLFRLRPAEITLLERRRNTGIMAAAPADKPVEPATAPKRDRKS
jgi:hypothetical protein